MKKKILLLFRIIGIIIVLGFISLIVFWKFNRLRGDISVTINGETYFAEQLECRYGIGDVEEVTYREVPRDAKVVFKNSGSQYNMYEYSFLISNGDINIEPKIQVFKTNWYQIYVVHMDFNIYEENGIWNAEVTVEARHGTYQETFYDIENNVIEMRVE